jgi:4-amino-4-deoxy-L-arabinose transferase-like glycosyltransferase
MAGIPVRLKILGGIVVLAAVLRLTGLDRIPQSPDWDEVAFGYNAYSILKTGRDEFGVRFPLAFKSFGEYKTPLYIYSTVPVFALFGMNLYTLRLFSAVSGVVGVIAAYLLTRQLGRDAVETLKRRRGTGSAETDVNPVGIALTSAFLLAVSPWHLQFSRMAFESMTAIIVLNTLGTLFFLKGMRNFRWLTASAVCFAVAMYGYHGTRVFTPLLAVYLAVTHIRTLLNRKILVPAGIAVVVGLVVLAPLLPVLTSDESRQRLVVTSPFFQQKTMLAETFAKLSQDLKTGDRLGQVFDNRRLVWATKFIEGYASHFSLRWLFVTGDKTSAITRRIWVSCTLSNCRFSCMVCTGSRGLAEICGPSFSAGSCWHPFRPRPRTNCHTRAGR